MQPYFTGKVRRESERQSVKLVNVHFTVTEQPETVVFAIQNTETVNNVTYFQVLRLFQMFID